MRRLTMPESGKHWSLRSVRTKLIKMGGCPVGHARRLVFQRAEVAVAGEGIPASVGAYRRALSSTRVANILEVIRGVYPMRWVPEAWHLQTSAGTQNGPYKSADYGGHWERVAMID